MEKSRLDQPLQTLRDLVKQLVPAIKTLEPHIKCLATFHDPVLLYNNTLTSSLKDTIINCIPITSRQSFSRRLQEFTEQDAQNGLAPSIFNFISDNLFKETKSFNNYLMENEEVIPSIKVEVKPVQTQQDSFNSGTSRNSFRHKPCSSCPFKGFNNQHYPLGKHCGITKLSSKEILQVMKRVNACFTCGFQHTPNDECKSTFPSGDSKACHKGCLHDGIPANLAICKHNDKAPSFTVSKLGSNSSSFGIQYDLGSQISLISKSTL